VCYVSTDGPSHSHGNGTRLTTAPTGQTLSATHPHTGLDTLSLRSPTPQRLARLLDTLVPVCTAGCVYEGIRSSKVGADPTCWAAATASSCSRAVTRW
jgi:hypothetical protein